MKRLLNRIFQLEMISGDGACPPYLYRWTLFGFRSWKVYLHRFVGDDWSRDQHDHPKRFISVGLKGSYVEDTPEGSRVYKAPWIRSFPATHIHRLRLTDNKDCWTLVAVLSTVRPWGFWKDGRWIPWRAYVKEAHLHAACND